MEQPFVTNNDAQAFALYIAGVPLAPPYATNKYTAEGLRALGFRGTLPIDAAKTAHAEGQRGAVHYYFEPDADCAELVAAYDDQIRRLSSDEAMSVREEIEAVRAVFRDGQITERECSVRESATVTRGRKLFLTLWSEAVPMLSIVKQGESSDETSADGKRTVTHPGFIEVSVNASDETKRRLGL